MIHKQTALSSVCFPVPTSASVAPTSYCQVINGDEECGQLFIRVAAAAAAVVERPYSAVTVTGTLQLCRVIVADWRHF